MEIEELYEFILEHKQDIEQIKSKIYQIERRLNELERIK